MRVYEGQDYHFKDKTTGETFISTPEQPTTVELIDLFIIFNIIIFIIVLKF